MWDDVLRKERQTGENQTTKLYHPPNRFTAPFFVHPFPKCETRSCLFGGCVCIGIVASAKYPNANGSLTASIKLLHRCHRQRGLRHIEEHASSNDGIKRISRRVTYSHTRVPASRAISMRRRNDKPSNSAAKEIEIQCRGITRRPSRR